MQINENGTVTFQVADLVMLKGIVKEGTNAGKPYTMVKIDSRKSFEVNPVQSDALQKQGIKVIDKTTSV